MYTQGEWKVEEWFTLTGKKGFTLLVEENGVKLVLARDIVNEANAHLIAAAPKMYEALRGILDQKDNPQLYTALSGQEWLDIEQALAKVEGKEIVLSQKDAVDTARSILKIIGGKE